MGENPKRNDSVTVVRHPPTLRRRFADTSPLTTQSAWLQTRGVHSIVQRLRTNPPARNQPAVVFFLLSLTEAWFLTNESKANEFDRRSFAKLELRKSLS